MPEKTLHVALVGGPMYDRLYERIPQFEAETGYQVRIGAKLPHPALNDHIAQVYAAGEGNYDLISTHSKYAPSQEQWLRPLEDLITWADLQPFIPSALELARIGDRLVGLPRNIDVRLLYYRTDVMDRPPDTWEELCQAARRVQQPALYGFVFPGRYSGLFGTFYELLGSAGGDLFDNRLRPIFKSDAGRWALQYLKDLHHTYRVTPPDLPDWHYDEVADCFRQGNVAMMTDWPGGFGNVADPQTSRVADRFDVAIYPQGPAGKRCVYSGGFTFAIPESVKDLEGAVALLKFLTGFESQLLEARGGAVSVRADVRQRIREEAPPGSLQERRLEYLSTTIASHMLIPPKFPEYPAAEDVLWEGVQAAMTGRLEVEQALTRMSEMIGEILREREDSTG